MNSISQLLVLHHSHTDIGYTHSQPVIWKLHSQYIDEALDLCEQTSDWPEYSRARWTCEITSPVLRWLERAPDRQIERFRTFAASGQISIGAMLYNTTPLMDADQIIRTLAPIKRLRKDFGVPIRVAINHDVNGLPWPIVGLLREAGIEMLLMGINITFGAFPLQRPRAFRWQGPDGQTIPVWHGEHYNTVAHVFKINQASTTVMAEGWNAYEKRLQAADYPYDFAFLTATHHDCFDNNPPDPLLPRMIRQWNDEGREPSIRFVSPEMLADKISQLPPDKMPLIKGDWTDLWNFGCASTGVVTRINRESKTRLRVAELLEASSSHQTSPLLARDFQEAWDHIHLFDEHSWGHHSSIGDTARDDVASSACLKDVEAYEGRALTSWILREQLELAAGNPNQGAGISGVLLLNPTAERRVEYPAIPTPFRKPGQPYHASRAYALDEAMDVTSRIPAEAFVLNAIEFEPYSVRFLPAKQWEEAPKASSKCNLSGQAIESPFYRLSFDASSGRITSLHDKRLGRELLDTSSPWSFFGMVQETVDLSKEEGLRPELSGRDAFFKVVPEDIFEGRTGWNKKWSAQRKTPGTPTKCVAVECPDGVALRINWDHGPGVEQLAVEIKLLAEHPEILCKTHFMKPDIRTPDGVYFTFPLAISPWRAHFDTADLPVEFEKEQIPGCSTDYVTVGSWVAVHQDGLSVTLACPDAPMVQLGDFRFARFAEAEREKNCLLLAWPLNNYWDTNFRTSQPGYHRYQYRFTTSAAFSPEEASRFGVVARTPIEIHPVLPTEPGIKSGPLLQMDNSSLQILSVRRVESGQNILVRLVNVTNREQQGRLRLTSLPAVQAWRCNTFEEPTGELPIEDGAVIATAKPGEVVSLLMAGR